jgi:hypothetical protein
MFSNPPVSSSSEFLLFLAPASQQLTHAPDSRAERRVEVILVGRALWNRVRPRKLTLQRRPDGFRCWLCFTDVLHEISWEKRLAPSSESTFAEIRRSVKALRFATLDTTTRRIT